MKHVIALALALSFALPLAAIAAPQGNEFQQNAPTSNINNTIYGSQGQNR